MSADSVRVGPDDGAGGVSWRGRVRRGAPRPAFGPGRLVPHAARRLTLHLLPSDPEAPPERVIALRERLLAAGFLDGDRPGRTPLVGGGFARARVEVFPAPRFASNGQGGFRVICPITAEGVVSAFSSALAAWRAGGPRAMACSCGARHDLAELRYAPEAGFARGWLTLLDAAAGELTPAGRALADAELGGLRLVGRRG